MRRGVPGTGISRELVKMKSKKTKSIFHKVSKDWKRAGREHSEGQWDEDKKKNSRYEND